MAKKTHFTGTGSCKIHTSRGSCRKSCNYQKANPRGPYNPQQAHHVLPVSSTIKYKSDKAYVGSVRRIDGAYWETDWCVNQSPNLIWLPLKGTYQSKSNNRGGTKASPAAVWSQNLPCHDWDHNCVDGYTDEVSDDFRKKVWDPIKNASQTKKACELSDEIVVGALSALQSKFMGELRGRGTRTKWGGTRGAILAQPQNGWWLPFSMAKAAVALRRSIAGFGRPKHRT